MHASPSCDVARVVLWRGLGFVGRFVFLVDNNKSKIFHGREYCRPCADYKIRLARAYLHKGIVPLASRKPRMDECYSTTVARAEYLQGLGRQSNLGKKHNNSLAALQCLVDSADYNAGLSASGNSVKQYCRCLSSVKMRFDRLKRLGLLLVEQDLGLVFFKALKALSPNSPLVKRYKPLFYKSLKLRAAISRRFFKLVCRHVSALFKQAGKYLLLLCRTKLCFMCSRKNAFALLRRNSQRIIVFKGIGHSFAGQQFSANVAL